MKVLLGFGAGLLAGGTLLVLLRPVLEHPMLQRENHRGHRLPTAGGVVALVAAVFVLATWVLIDRNTPVQLVLPTLLGFGVLGLLDDLVGSGADGRGFSGHLRALGRGRLTTGGLKLLGGGAIGVFGGALWDDRPVRILLDAALIALAANLGNLLDRAPGRTLKVGALAAVVVTVLSGLHRPQLVGPAIAVGALLALLPSDLGERLMVGDTGANALGAVLGLAVVLTTSFPIRMVVLVGVLFLNALSEVVSFSKIIDGVGPLRWIDRAGRQPRYPDLP